MSEEKLFAVGGDIINWILRSPSGEYNFNTTSATRKALENVARGIFNKEWRILYLEGYRCVRMEFTEELS